MKIYTETKTKTKTKTNTKTKTIFILQCLKITSKFKYAGILPGCLSKN